jgi:hypothetical protein
MLNRTFVAVLAEKCPFYQVPLPDCGLGILRGNGDKGNVRKRLDDLSDQEIDDLIRHHLICVCRRDGCDGSLPKRAAAHAEDDDLWHDDYMDG